MINGRINQYLSNSTFNYKSSFGNARCESYKNICTSRMSNTYIKCGERIDVNDLIFELADGLYIEKLKKGELLIEQNLIKIFVDLAYAIKNGKKSFDS